MFGKIITILSAVAFIVSVATAGPYKAPKRVGLEPSPVTDGNIPPMVSALGPGDSVGYTLYDYGTNGSAVPVLINYGDGQLSLARMAAIDAATDTRGSYYKFYDGAAWSSSWSRIETVRRGWACIAQIADAGGVEVVSSHVYEVNVDAGRGANVWSPSFPGCVEGTWPRIAIGNGFTFHAIGTSVPAIVGYHQSLDAGATWSCDMNLVTEPEVIADADGYALTAKGDMVAFVIAGAFGDVAIYESADNGATWTETLLYDIDGTGATDGDEPADGSCDIIYDSNNNLHVAWGCYQFQAGVGGSARDAGIRHWSSASNTIQEIAFANPDTNITDPGGRDGNYATGPDFAADANGNVVMIYSTFVADTDDSLRNYEHVFAMGSSDGGVTWGGSVDVTAGTGFDAAFPSVAELADDYIHFIYMCDPLAGNWLQATHEQITCAYMYHMYSVADILAATSVKPLDNVIPDAFKLEQNYPNPFNPTTNIRYSVPTGGMVSLKIYDMVGQEVATLVNGHQDAGNYVADFNATNLANGTYFYTLTAGSFTETKKMMLIK
jgi:hypothetical protein